MAPNAKLNDLQLVLLSTAAQRENGSILPPADSIAAEKDRIQKAIPPLLKRGLIEEVGAKRGVSVWRGNDGQPIRLRLTDAGRTLILPEEREPDAAPQEKNTSKQTHGAVSAPRSGSKSELVLELLGRSEGATLSELVHATGWLPHTMRAALTGLRKRGHHVEKSKRDDATCYRIVEAD